MTSRLHKPKANQEPFRAQGPDQQQDLEAVGVEKSGLGGGTF
jgi:hypothetical protein